MPQKLICSVSLPPATTLSVPIYDFAIANEEVANKDMEDYYPCCGKSICGGCAYSFDQSGNEDTCPFCNADQADKTEEERVGEIMKRVAANDPASMYLLAGFCQLGLNGFQRDQKKAIEHYTRAADLGCSKAHCNLGMLYDEGGNMKKAKFHFEAAAMAGNELARYNLGIIEAESGTIERAVKHWTIGASGGHYCAMHNLLIALKKGHVSRESIDSTLAAYNSSCTEMRSEDRDACIQFENDRI
jgi:TPR repeat protein